MMSVAGAVAGGLAGEFFACRAQVGVVLRLMSEAAEIEVFLFGSKAILWASRRGGPVRRWRRGRRTTGRRSVLR